MRIDVLTLFPAMFKGPLSESILKRAQEEKLIEVRFHDLRDYGKGKYKQVDDRPYGGGAGMLLMCEPVVTAIETIRGKEKAHCIFLAPAGTRLKQSKVEQIAKKYDRLILVCAHYEGIDQRIIDGGWIDEVISIGDYVLTGGELPAMVLIDAVARHIPGVLGKDESAEEESFSKSLKRKREYPHYTRPEEFRGLRVPDILISGDHGKIKKWRESNTH